MIVGTRSWPTVRYPRPRCWEVWASAPWWDAGAARSAWSAAAGCWGGCRRACVNRATAGSSCTKVSSCSADTTNPGSTARSAAAAVTGCARGCFVHAPQQSGELPHLNERDRVERRHRRHRYAVCVRAVTDDSVRVVGDSVHDQCREDIRATGRRSTP